MPAESLTLYSSTHHLSIDDQVFRTRPFFATGNPDTSSGPYPRGRMRNKETPICEQHADDSGHVTNTPGRFAELLCVSKTAEYELQGLNVSPEFILLPSTSEPY